MLPSRKRGFRSALSQFPFPMLPFPFGNAESFHSGRIPSTHKGKESVPCLPSPRSRRKSPCPVSRTWPRIFTLSCRPSPRDSGLRFSMRRGWPSSRSRGDGTPSASRVPVAAGTFSASTPLRQRHSRRSSAT